MTEHEDKFRWVCPFCRKYKDSESELKRHIRKHIYRHEDFNDGIVGPKQSSVPADSPRLMHCPEDSEGVTHDEDPTCGLYGCVPVAEADSPKPVSEEEERKAFEAASGSIWPSASLERDEPNSPFVYINSFIQVAWEGWLARARQAAAHKEKP
jgi:hypothetical protein